MKLTRKEFERLALEQIDLLYRLARKLTRDAERAEDLVQETYLRAIRSWERFDLQQFGMRPWLVRILHNLYLTKGQREARAPITVDDNRLDAADNSAGSATFDLEAVDQELTYALDALPTAYRTVLVLWAVEELSYQEIADALGIPIGTVMSRLHRARKRAIDDLKAYARERRLVRGNSGVSRAG
jgi:RNA polymerase sigma-70 factor, ECF subfamily